MKTVRNPFIGPWVRWLGSGEKTAGGSSGDTAVHPGGPRPRHSPSRLRSECSVLSTPVLTPVTLITPACCHVTSRTASEGLPGKRRCLFRPDTRSQGREVKAQLCLPWVAPRPSGPAPRKSGANLSPTPAPPRSRAPRAGTTSRFHSKRPSEPSPVAPDPSPSLGGGRSHVSPLMWCDGIFQASFQKEKVNNVKALLPLSSLLRDMPFGRATWG